MRFTAVLLGLLWAGAAQAAYAPSILQIQADPAGARGAAGLDPVVSTLDQSANGGLRVYGDAFTFDSRACYSTGNVAFCQTAANASATVGNVVTVDVLPSYIAEPNVPVTGTNVLANSVVTSFTGTPGGPGTVTLNNTPSGAVSAFKFGTPATVITFNNSGSLVTTIGMTQGGMTVTLGTAWCKSEYAGMPISIPGAGPGGGPLNTRITACGSAIQPATVFGVEDQAAATISASATLTYGVNFTTACPSGGYEKTAVTGCVGSGMLAANWAGAGGKGPSAIPTTISAVYAPNIIALGIAGTGIINQENVHFATGHDDSAAINASCAYARSNHIRILGVPAKHYVPTLGRECYASVLLRGTGRLIGNDGLRGFLWSGQFPPYPDPVVVPWDAPAPQPPRKSVIASSHLKLFRTTLTPTIISTYDSLSNMEANQVSDMGSYPYALLTTIKRQNPGLGLSFQNPGTTGGTMAAVMNGVAGVVNAPCVLNTTTSWFSQVAANCPSQLFTVGGGTNDDAGFLPGTILDTYLKLQGYGGFYSRPQDIIYYTNHPRSRMLQGNISGTPGEDGAEFGAGMLCSFAKIEGYPCIDVFNEGQKHVWGYDSHAMKMERAYDLPYGTNTAAMPIVYTRSIYGFAIKLTTTNGTFGSAFWANMTGNSGATDPRGPMISFRASNNSAAISGGYVTVRLFYQTGPGTVALECDMGDLMPGMACDDTVTGKPPTTPASVQGTVTVANNGTSGHATVVLSGATTPTFVGCVVGATVTVPTADASVPAVGVTAYNAPFIGTVSTCDSSTQITLTTAVTTPVVFTGTVFWGSPLITSQNVVDGGDGNNNEILHLQLVGDDLLIWVGRTSNVLYAGKIWRPRSRMPLIFYSGGNRPAITVMGSPTAGGTTFATAQPIPNQTGFTDDDMVGPSGVTPVNNQTYMGKCGGDGYAHNCESFGRKVVEPAFAAQDWALGNGGVSVNVNSGAAYTVPNCLVGAVYVNDTTAPTITLPTYCANPIVVQDGGGQAGTHTITVATPSGVTLSGAATITANFGARTIRWTGPNAAVSQ